MNPTVIYRGLALALVSGALLGGLTAPSASGRSIVTTQAQFGRQTMDKMGFRWDINTYGAVQSGTNSCFSNAMYMTLNGTSQNFRPQQSSMTPDGTTYELNGNHSGVQIRRRVKIDVKNSAVRFFDTFTNPTSAPRNLTVVYHVSLQEQCQVIQTDQGNGNPTVLKKGESGLIAVRNPGSSRPSVYFALAKSNAKVKPTIYNNNNYQLRFTYTLTIPAKKSTSLLQVLAQRRLAVPPTPKQIKAAMKPFYGYSFLRDMSASDRKTLSNWRGSGYLSLRRGAIDPAELFGVEPAGTDILALGEESRLRGTATCEKIEFESRFGKRTISFDQVLALSGQRFHRAPMTLFLKDGQVLYGKIKTTGLGFVLASGLKIDLNIDSLDRLMLRPPTQVEAIDNEFGLIETYDGYRIAVATDSKTRLIAATPWGQLDVPMEEVLRIATSDEGSPGHVIELVNGSRFFGFLMGAKIQFKTQLFDVQTISLNKIRSYIGPLASVDREQTSQVSDGPHVRLVGGSILGGRIDLDKIEFADAGGNIPIPPSQIRLLQNITLEEDDEAAGNSMLYRAELWDGSVVVGRLVQRHLPIRIGGRIWKLPASDLLEAHVPTPIVSDALRQKVAGFVADLGHPEWRKREAASEAIRQLDALARDQLNDALRTAKDPEVRRRIEQLLQEIEK
jgi:hypothetical protein